MPVKRRKGRRERFRAFLRAHTKLQCSCQSAAYQVVNDVTARGQRPRLTHLDMHHIAA